MAVAAHVETCHDMLCNANISEGGRPHARQFGELVQHLRVAVSGRIFVQRNSDEEPSAYALDEQAGVKIDGQRYQFALKGRVGDGGVERHGPDGQLESELMQPIGRLVPGTNDDTNTVE